MSKLNVWAALTNPMTHIGLISTEVEYDKGQVIGPGLNVVTVTAPGGQQFVFDETTGALLGRDLGAVQKDYSLLMDRNVPEGEPVDEKQEEEDPMDTLRDNRNKMKDVTDQAKKVDRYEFFRLLHAA